MCGKVDRWDLVGVILFYDLKCKIVISNPW